MENQVSADEISRAKLLHGYLLFDFIVVHVFVFVVALGLMSTSLIPLMLMPVLSLSLLGTVILKASKSKAEPSQFVRCHMLLAAKRAKLFMGLFVVTFSFTAFMLFAGSKLGFSPIASKSLAFGIGQLPFMVALLALVVMEYDAEHQCKTGKIPAAALKLDSKEA